MPVYRVTIKGDDKVRLVRADSASKALKHIADADTVTADEMAGLLDAGAVLESASKAPAAPDKVEEPPKAEDRVIDKGGKP